MLIVLFYQIDMMPKECKNFAF